MFITFSLIQLNSKTDEFEKNFSNAEKFLSQLPISEKHIVLLPELWTGGFSEDLEKSNKTNLEIISSLKKIADGKNIIIAGSYIIKEDNKFYNQLLIINSNGIIAKYNKKYLFPQLNESKLLQPGKELSILKIWDIQIGMAVCYDLRFSEIFRDYAAYGVEICLLPAQWPMKRISHFSSLVIGRAIENQTIMVASNVSGKIGQTQLGGNSILIDHNGEIRSKMDQEQGFTSTRINMEEQKMWRKSFPVLKQANLVPREDIKFYVID